MTSFETTLKNYLDNRAKSDSAFAEKYANPAKSLEGCCKYIFQEVKKLLKKGEPCVGCPDDEVYGMAVHYYDEPDIVVNHDTPTPEVQSVKDPEVMVTPATPEEKPKATKKGKRGRPKKSDAPTPEEQSEVAASPEVEDELPDELEIQWF